MRLLTALLMLLWAAPLWAAASDPVRGIHVEGRLITAEAGVSGRTVSAGLDLQLDPGWKTYWRSPGEVGLPPALDWSGSTNLKQAELAYPAPERFVAFDIENYGYGDRVVFPLTLEVEDPYAPLNLRLQADILVCAEICIPETLTLALDLPGASGVDTASATLLAEWVARVPGTTAFTLDQVHLDQAALTVSARADAPLSDPQVFPEQEGASFGAPRIVRDADGQGFWVRLPVLRAGTGPLDLTLVDGRTAATLRADLATTAPAAPGAPALGLGRILLLALIGGLILNIMPCVLPVLSIKLARALEARDRGAAAVRLSFLTTAAGIITFFVLLAIALISAQTMGAVVGWGVQFQQPAFLALLAMLMVIFAANLFGAFEIQLPGRAQTAMGRAGGSGRMGDFATGAFAALMATPCSAPFLGTAVAYALTQSPTTSLVVFLALGTGLALPYLAVAALPGLVRLLPRPGRWMVTLRNVLGGLMLVATAWVLTLLWSGAGQWTAVAIGVLAVALLVGLMRVGQPGRVSLAGLALAVGLAALLPGPTATRAEPDTDWVAFAPETISTRVSAGEVVFVDVTADWCLTCQANKRLVLDRSPVRDLLDGTVRMQADWTRPDPVISDYLASHGRYGIPFNVVYGPGAPEGIVLPELLNEARVTEAVTRARR